MKELKLSKLFAGALVFALIFGNSACQKDEDLKDDCDRLITDTEYLDVSVKARVEHSDFIPFDGPVRLRIYKTYCNGTVSGDFEQTGVTDEEGYYDPHYTYTYKYENLQDKVDLKWYVTDHTGTERHVASDIFYYHDAEDAQWIVNDVYEIQLSWDAP